MSSHNEPLVQVDSVSIARRGKHILNNISWQVDPGQHWVILGPNGAGKTSLARLIAGRDNADSGSVVVLGEDLSQADRSTIASQVGFASADIGQRISAGSSVLSVVASAAWGQGSQYTEEYEELDTSRAQDLLAALGVDSLAQRSYDSLSEGEKRRVLLARALMPDPEIIILDEPTAGLDLGGRETLFLALSEIMESKTAPTVILITHEPEQIIPSFTHALTLRDGAVVSHGPIDEVVTSDTLSEVFQLPLEVTRENGRIWATAKR